MVYSLESQMRPCKVSLSFAQWKSGSSWLGSAKWDRVLRSSCHCSPVWHFRIWQTRVSPGLSGLVPPVAPQATAPDGEISSLRPRKPRLPVAWPASLILSMTRLSVSQTSRCPANCRSNLNLWQSVQLTSLSYVATLRFNPLAHPGTALAWASRILSNLQAASPAICSCTPRLYN